MSELPKYFKKQLEQFQKLISKPGYKPGLFHSVIEHDDDCMLLKGLGICDCEPNVLPPMTDEQFEEYKRKKDV